MASSRTTMRPIDDAGFQQDISNLVDDNASSDAQLFDRAQVSLSVLSKPEHAHYNTPRWVTRLAAALRTESTGFTARRLFAALYETADKLGLRDGRRYLSAMICACAKTVEEKNAHSIRMDEEAQLAANLSQLADTWVAYFLWPCKSANRRICTAPSRVIDAL